MPVDEAARVVRGFVNSLGSTSEPVAAPKTGVATPPAKAEPPVKAKQPPPIFKPKPPMPLGEMMPAIAKGYPGPPASSTPGPKTGGAAKALPAGHGVQGWGGYLDVAGKPNAERYSYSEDYSGGQRHAREQS